MADIVRNLQYEPERKAVDRPPGQSTGQFGSFLTCQNLPAWDRLSQHRPAYAGSNPDPAWKKAGIVRNFWRLMAISGVSDTVRYSPRQPDRLFTGAEVLQRRRRHGYTGIDRIAMRSIQHLRRTEWRARTLRGTCEIASISRLDRRQRGVIDTTSASDPGILSRCPTWGCFKS